ncbi:unnamed protein product [Blepharisma stoltei]|uniref:Uncharacterized protein n=1 Tax=Blepharisma stoltei TaxID=1481888 RepID=A0AAU9JWK2_9CILI|nr:unnamed protein product [Blepharisma stoltei]
MIHQKDKKFLVITQDSILPPSNPYLFGMYKQQELWSGLFTTLFQSIKKFWTLIWIATNLANVYKKWQKFFQSCLDKAKMTDLPIPLSLKQLKLNFH